LRLQCSRLPFLAFFVSSAGRQLDRRRVGCCFGLCPESDVQSGRKIAAVVHGAFRLIIAHKGTVLTTNFDGDPEPYLDALAPISVARDNLIGHFHRNHHSFRYDVSLDLRE
jgi:hypothetical protein